jgi:hypothetical protein
VSKNGYDITSIKTKESTLENTIELGMAMSAHMNEASDIEKLGAFVDWQFVEVWMYFHHRYVDKGKRKNGKRVFEIENNHKTLP